jgi:NAD(P)-dependent dehydrogenase (short-subunit alcohol dehydrogenase family)
MTNQRGRLAGKVAIVTGAGSRGPGVGTGKAISVLFAREGARVCLMDIDTKQAEETLEVIRQEGGEAFVVSGDVTKKADCERVVQAAVETYGRLTTLVNNVGSRTRAGVT